MGVEINGDYLAQARDALRGDNALNVELFHSDFFDFEWTGALDHLPSSLLVVGNPPWVTNA